MSNLLMIPNTNVLDTNRVIDPILLQDKAHPKASNKYRQIQTLPVLNYFEQEGFQWQMYQKARARKIHGYGKHTVLVTSKKLGFKSQNLAKEMQFRCLVGNSHDTSWAFFIKGFIDREICSNKMVMSNALFQTIRLVHRTDMITLKDVQEAVHLASQQLVSLEDKILNLQSLILTKDQKQEFARLVALKRLANLDIVAVNSEVLLQPNRIEDATDSAWHVVNTVQENLFSLQNYKTLNYKAKIVNDENQEIIEKEGNTRRLSGIMPGINLNAYLFDAMQQVTQKSELALVA